MKLKIGDRIECPFCEAYAVKPPSKHVEDNPIWSLPNNSPLNQIESLREVVGIAAHPDAYENWEAMLADAISALPPWILESE